MTAWNAASAGSTGTTGDRRLILLRHGQSTYNAANLFTGWADPPLTPLGEREAARAGSAIAAAGLTPHVVFTSLLQRAVATTRLVVEAADCAQVPVYRSWRLNGRHYGALQGRDKALAERECGAQQVLQWRRSYDARPPALLDDPDSLDPRYAHVPLECLPHTESLRDVTARLLPYWRDAIVPQLRTGATVLVVGHGNTLRALIKFLDRIPDHAVMRLEVPTARPVLYEFGADMKPLFPGGRPVDLVPSPV